MDLDIAVAPSFNRPGARRPRSARRQLLRRSVLAPRSQAVRTQVNRVIVGMLLLGALPHVVIAERLRPGRGHQAARRWIRAGARLTGLRFERRGVVEPQPAGLQVLVANHSSLLDAAAVLATHPTARFVAGADLFNIPLLGAAMRALGTVPVDRKGDSKAHLTVSEQDPPQSLMVFAEGRIAPVGHRLPFRRGAFALAIESGAEVIPVAIHHSARCLPPGGALAVRPGAVVVEYLPRVETKALTSTDRYRLSADIERTILATLDPGDGGYSRRVSSLPARVG